MGITNFINVNPKPRMQFLAASNQNKIIDYGTLDAIYKESYQRKKAKMQIKKLVTSL